MKKIVFALSLGLIVACDSGEGGGDDSDGDSGVNLSSECGFEGDSYLPIAVGNTWSYTVVDKGSGELSSKSQTIEEELNDPTFGDVFVQVTGKGQQSETRSLLSVVDSEVRRRQQEDIDAGVVTKTTLYSPHQTRLSGLPENLEAGATWTETYTPNVDGLDTEVRVEEWTVESTTAPCELPSEEVVDCLQVRRVRNAGVVTKTFWYARGIGKVMEEGTNQDEVLSSCSKN